MESFFDQEPKRMAAGGKRLEKEFQQLRRDDQKKVADGLDFDIKLFPNDTKKLDVWTAYIKGPPDTAFEGGVFQLRLEIPRKYPHEPPKIKFVTKVCHPNVNFQNGEICLDVLKDAWTPVWTLESVTRAVVNLLEKPEADSPLNCDAGNLIRADDMRGFLSMARMYTLEYAMKQMP